MLALRGGKPDPSWGTEIELGPFNYSFSTFSHFISVGPNLASKLPSGSTSFDSYVNPVSTTFNLQHTSTTEVLKLLGKLSPNKATGLDNISCRLLKEAGPIIATSLACITNKTIDTGLFPSQWKMAKVYFLCIKKR